MNTYRKPFQFRPFSSSALSPKEREEETEMLADERRSNDVDDAREEMAVAD